TRSPVKDQFFGRVLVTAQLAFGAALVWLAIGIPIGIISAVRSRTFTDRAAMGFALFFVAAPVFWLGLMGLWLFWYKLRWSPGTGYVAWGDSFTDWLSHMILPWVVLAMLYAAFYARMVRGNMIETMQQDYIRTARVKGLSESKVIFKHGLRASLTPVVTLIGLDLGALLGGAGVNGSVFKLQGVGQWTVNSVFQGDLPVILAVTVVVAIAVTLMNLVVDIVYAYLDPRARYNEPSSPVGGRGCSGSCWASSTSCSMPALAWARFSPGSRGKWQAARAPPALGSGGGPGGARR